MTQNDLKNPPPEPPQGKPPVNQAERTADDQISTSSSSESAPAGMTNEDQEPSSQMESGADKPSENEESEQAETVWRKARRDPIAFFTSVLAVCTAVLSLATVVLAGATIALWLATERLVHYAEEQAGDMKSSIQAARDAAKASDSMSKSAVIAIEIARNQVGYSKEVLDRQKAHVAVQMIEIRSFDAWETATLNARIQFKNSGQTEATNVRVVGRVTVGNPKRPPSCGIDVRGVVPTTIGPNGDHSISVRHPLVGVQKERIREGSLAIYVYGRVTYTDILDAARFRNFRLFYQGDGSAQRDTFLKMANTPGCNDSN